MTCKIFRDRLQLLNSLTFMRAKNFEGWCVYQVKNSSVMEGWGCEALGDLSKLGHPDK